MKGLCFALFLICFRIGLFVFSYEMVTKNHLQYHVQILTAPDMQGRLTGSIGEKRATQYVADAFYRLGLEPAGDQGTYFQPFRFKRKGKLVQGRNVLARLNVTSHPIGMLVVGAHGDHLGHGNWGGSLARQDERGKVHPGADDNASGVASMLEAARALSRLKAQGKLQGNRDILFAAWSGEELGVLGSSHFVTHYKTTPALDAAINLDMVGHLRRHLVLQGVGSSPDWPALIKTLPISIIGQNDPYLPTDALSFYLHGVPALNFFTGAHVHYHTPRDTPETLNYEGMQTITHLLIHLVRKMESTSHPIHYQAIAKPNHLHQRSLKVYLGTIPDYASLEKSGVKISGVAKDSPAEQAGIQPQDVIIELAGKKIHDIYEYSGQINKMTAGQPTHLVVLRSHEKVPLTIVAQYR